MHLSSRHMTETSNETATTLSITLEKVFRALPWPSSTLHTTHARRLMMSLTRASRDRGEYRKTALPGPDTLPE